MLLCIAHEIQKTREKHLRREQSIYTRNKPLMRERNMPPKITFNALSHRKYKGRTIYSMFSFKTLNCV